MFAHRWQANVAARLHIISSGFSARVAARRHISNKECLDERSPVQHHSANIKHHKPDTKHLSWPSTIWGGTS